MAGISRSGGVEPQEPRSPRLCRRRSPCCFVLRRLLGAPSESAIAAVASVADLGLPFVGVGFLYPQGYFSQRITEDGWQEAYYDRLDLSEVPVVPIEAERGGDAVRLAVEDPPHVAVIGHHLPEMSGADVVRTLRAVDNDAVRTMPIVGVSGRFGSEQALMAAGACCFLAKPFRDDEVVRAIRWALDVYCQEQRARSRGASSES